MHAFVYATLTHPNKVSSYGVESTALIVPKKPYSNLQLAIDEEVHELVVEK